MGYCGLDDFGAGDDSFGRTLRIFDQVAKELKAELRNQGSTFNPSGAVNVGLINESLLVPIRGKVLSKLYCGGDLPLLEVLTKAKEKLDKEIKRGEKEDAEEWGGIANKNMHIKAYKRLSKGLNLTIRALKES